MKARRTWQEKLADSNGFPKVAKIDGQMSKRWGTGTFVIPAPLEVDGLMRRVRKGKLTTIDQLRTSLARMHKATIACPITTGIFAWIAAHAADERQREGKSRVTPYWRTLKTGGEINPKYPGGVARIMNLLKVEGHVIVQRGKRFFVVGYEERLAKI